jgi:GntR family transcriptional regulator, phosphonate transport system regulatory protein
MPRPALFTAIAEALRTEIAAGQYRPGDRLPSEAGLADRFGVNRHTVRRALSELADAGLVHARRGAGVFVAARPMDYALGRRVRWHQNIAASGRMPSRRLTRRETLPAAPAEAEALRLAPADAVHVIEGVSLADGEALAVFRSVFPAGRFPDLLEVLAREPSVTAALKACGLDDYTRVETRLTAKTADPVLAAALRIRPGDAVLRSVAINADAGGTPVEFGTTWFAGDRMTLTVAGDQGA